MGGLLTYVVACKQRSCSSVDDVFLWKGWGGGGIIDVRCCLQTKARSLHADRTRGQSGHKEGQPDEYALVALLLAVKENAGELQRLIDVFLADHPPKDPKLASAVKVCRVQNMHVSTHKKMFLRLADEHKPLEQALVAALVADGGMQLFGQAPRGSLERKAIDLMQKLGVKNN